MSLPTDGQHHVCTQTPVSMPKRFQACGKRSTPVSSFSQLQPTPSASLPVEKLVVANRKEHQEKTVETRPGGHSLLFFPISSFLPMPALPFQKAQTRAWEEEPVSHKEQWLQLSLSIGKSQFEMGAGINATGLTHMVGYGLCVRHILKLPNYISTLS